MSILTGLFLGLAGFVFGLTGFGYSLTAVSLLSLLYPVPVAVALQFAHTLLVAIYNVWKYRALIRLRELWLILIGASLMVPFGVLALDRVPETFMKYCLSIFILLSVFISRLPLHQKLSGDLQKSKALALFAGGISGYFQGAYTTGAPPAIIYILAREKDPRLIKGFIAFYLLYLHLLTGFVYATANMLSGDTIMTSLLWLPATVIGMYLGGRLFTKIDISAFRLAVDILLILTAISLVII